MSDLESVDFFKDRSVFSDPYPYLEHLRAQCPVQREPHHDVVMVTGYDEAIAVYSDPATFSSCNSVSGPFPGLPVPLEGDDISDLIAQHRDELPFSDQLPSFDPPKHTQQRALLLRLITPKRLKENEEFMWRYADQQIDEFHAKGACEYITEYAQPYTLLVIADLLGVPEADHGTFRTKLTSPTDLSKGGEMEHRPLEFLYEQFKAYIDDRRRHPSGDVMTGLASATYPDGSTPDAHDVALIAANLFVAGQETTVRLLSSALQLLAERPDIQQLLRAERERIPNFVEEMLRIESPIAGEFRLSRVPTSVGGVDLPAGTTVMIMNGAANRDPRRFDNPQEFQVDRANARQHVAFGHGIHTCVGRAPRTRGSAREHRTAARPHGRHPDLRSSTRPGRRPALRVRTHLSVARPHEAALGVHPRRLRRDATMSDAIEHYDIRVDDAVLDDLRDRLSRTRVPDEIDDTGWEYGIPYTYLRELIVTWRDTYDWRAQEARLNALGNFRTRIDAQAIHFVHARAADANAFPLLLVHGWPGSIVEFLDVIPRLTGAETGDAFHVVAPSLPGYGFSEPTRTRGWDVTRIARAFIELMARLGYTRYGVQGGDWGAQIATRIGALDPEHCVAIHLNMPIADRPDDAPPLTDSDKADLAATAQFARDESGYALEQSTKPQTIGVALNDSPAGLLAWVVEKFQAWSDCDGHPENVFTREQLLTNTTLYWVTQTSASAARLYWEHTHSNEPAAFVAVPTGVARYPKEVLRYPRAWVERRYNVTYWAVHAARRALRRDGTTRVVHRRRTRVLPHGSVTLRLRRRRVAQRGDNPAVDTQINTRDERRGRAHEKLDGGRNVVGGSDPAGTGPVDHVAHHIAERSGELGVPHRGCDHARTQRHDPPAPPAPSNGRGFDPNLIRALGDAVRGARVHDSRVENGECSQRVGWCRGEQPQCLVVERCHGAGHARDAHRRQCRPAPTARTRRVRAPCRRRRPRRSVPMSPCTGDTPAVCTRHRSGPRSRADGDKRRQRRAPTNTSVRTACTV